MSVPEETQKTEKSAEPESNGICKNPNVRVVKTRAFIISLLEKSENQEPPASQRDFLETLTRREVACEEIIRWRTSNLKKPGGGRETKYPSRPQSKIIRPIAPTPVGPRLTYPIKGIVRPPMSAEEQTLRDKIKELSAWTSRMKSKESESNEVKLENEMKFSLNQLTPDNYDSLKDKILDFSKLSRVACEKMVNLMRLSREKPSHLLRGGDEEREQDQEERKSRSMHPFSNHLF